MSSKNTLTRKLYSFLDEERADEKSVHTLEHYEHVIKLFIDFLEDDSFDKLDLMRFKGHLIDKYSSATVANYIVIINKFVKYFELTQSEEEFDLFKLRKYYSKNLLKNIRLQKKSSLEDVLEPEELKRMLRVSKKDNIEDYLIIKILAYTGIRAEELHFFTYENLKSNYIEVRNKGKIRRIIVRQDLRKELLSFCKQEGIENGPIFRGRDKSKALHYTTVYKRIKKVAGKCRGISLKKVHPHSFRHLFAVKFIEDGGDLSELADILGHSSIETTRIYTRTTDYMKRKKLENMKF